MAETRAAKHLALLHGLALIMLNGAKKGDVCAVTVISTHGKDAEGPIRIIIAKNVPLTEEERLHANGILQAVQNTESADDLEAMLYQIVPPFCGLKFIERLERLQKSLKRLPQIKFLSRRTTEYLLRRLQPNAANIVNTFTDCCNFLERVPLDTRNFRAVVSLSLLFTSLPDGLKIFSEDTNRQLKAVGEYALGIDAISQQAFERHYAPRRGDLCIEFVCTSFRTHAADTVTTWFPSDD